MVAASTAMNATNSSRPSQGTAGKEGRSTWATKGIAKVVGIMAGAGRSRPPLGPAAGRAAGAAAADRC